MTYMCAHCSAPPRYCIKQWECLHVRTHSVLPFRPLPVFGLLCGCVPLFRLCIAANEQIVMKMEYCCGGRGAAKSSAFINVTVKNEAKMWLGKQTIRQRVWEKTSSQKSALRVWGSFGTSCLQERVELGNGGRLRSWGILGASSRCDPGKHPLKPHSTKISPGRCGDYGRLVLARVFFLGVHKNG